MKNNDTVKEVSDAFSEVLREWLTGEQIEEVIKLNTEEEGDLICHSHDFCDANVAMLIACEKAGIDPIEDFEGRNIAEQAWKLSKQNSFKVS